MKFNVELIDVREYAVGREQERVPFRPFDIDLHDERRGIVGVMRELIGERVERTPVLGGSGRPDAFAVKHRAAARARRRAQVKTVVLVHRHVQLARHVASPSVVAGDPV